MSWEPMLEICSPFMLASFLACGTALSSCVDSHLAAGVAGLHVALGRTGDGAAGGEHHDGRQIALSFAGAAAWAATRCGATRRTEQQGQDQAKLHFAGTWKPPIA